jgi:hypothetical protein
MGEFVDGFEMLADVGPAVTIFGSARVGVDDPMYQRQWTWRGRSARRVLRLLPAADPALWRRATVARAKRGARSVGLISNSL